MDARYTLEERVADLLERVEMLETPQVDIQVLRTKDAKLPIRATQGSSGYDIYNTKRITVHPDQGGVLIPTGLRMKIPEGYELQVRPKSGLALKLALTVLNSPGTIDSDYRGEIGVIMMNHGENDHVFEPYSKIAQIVCCKVSPINFVEVNEDEYNREDSTVANERGTGGFGSTGAK